MDNDKRIDNVPLPLSHVLALYDWVYICNLQFVIGYFISILKEWAPQILSFYALIVKRVEKGMYIKLKRGLN